MIKHLLLYTNVWNWTDTVGNVVVAILIELRDKYL